MVLQGLACSLEKCAIVPPSLTQLINITKYLCAIKHRLYVEENLVSQFILSFVADELGSDRKRL